MFKGVSYFIFVTVLSYGIFEFLGWRFTEIDPGLQFMISSIIWAILGIIGIMNFIAEDEE